MSKIALFIGNDITAHLIMNEVVKAMVEDFDIRPVLFFPKHPISKKAQLPELKNIAFLERELLNDVVYPYIENRPYAKSGNLSPSQLAEAYDLRMETVDDVNDPVFVKSLLDDGITSAISIRCFQIFQRPIIDQIKSKGLFLNLHPGLLPEYRGVMSTARRMFDIATGKADNNDYGCTVHKVEQGIDAGKILTVNSIPLKPSHTAFMANIELADVAARTIIKTIQQMEEGETLRGYPQPEDPALYKYFTFPTSEELNEWELAGITLIDNNEVAETLTQRFSKAGTDHGNALKAEINSAINSRNGPIIPPRIANDKGGPHLNGPVAVYI